MHQTPRNNIKNTSKHQEITSKIQVILTGRALEFVHVPRTDTTAKNKFKLNNCFDG